MQNHDLQNLLTRTTLNIPFEEFLIQLRESYPQVGQIEKFEPFLQGYEDANIKLFTSTGIYVIKIFLKKRTLQNVLDYVKVLNVARLVDVPVVKLVKGKNGVLGFIEKDNVKTSYYVSEFFDGNNFEEITPGFNDIKMLAGYLAKLNTLDFPISETYDSWGNRNLVSEYQKSKNSLTIEQNELVEPIVNKLKEIYFTEFTTGVIHGDLQRQHVLKNKNGQYCILDFGCMSNAPIVIDISVYLAWYCLAQDTWNKKDEIIKIVLSEYEKKHKLSKEELSSLSTLVKAAYAAYYLRTSVLIRNGDLSRETKKWYDNAQEMLYFTKDWNF